MGTTVIDGTSQCAAVLREIDWTGSPLGLPDHVNDMLGTPLHAAGGD